MRHQPVSQTHQGLFEELEALSLFEGIQPEDLDWLIRNSSVRYEKSESVLLSPEKINHTAYIILSGRIDVRLNAAGEMSHTYLDAGNWVGEMSIIEDTIPSALVITDTDCRLLAIPGDILWQLIDRSHAVARNLLHEFSARVRRDNLLITESMKQQRQYAESAQTDFLTDLRNRRWLDKMLPRLVQRSRLQNQMLSLIMLDIDHFKKYNDENGHIAGDRAIQVVANAIQSHLRTTDTAVRYGGEEFVVLMPNTNNTDAAIIAKRLCDEIRDQKINQTDGTALPSVTVSIGYSSLIKGNTFEDLLAAADAALYRAKNSGRDQVAM